jgi:hypothetical protein
VPLPSREVDRERQAVAVDQQVELGREATARAAERVVLRLARDGLFGAPAAEWLARTLVPQFPDPI